MSLPKEVREKLNIIGGSTLSVEEKEGAVVLKVAPPQPKESKAKTNGVKGTKAAREEK